MLHCLMDEETQMVFPQLVLHARRHQIRLIRLVRQKSSHTSLSASSCTQLQASSHALSKAPSILSGLRGAKAPLFHGGAYGGNEGQCFMSEVPTRPNLPVVVQISRSSKYCPREIPPPAGENAGVRDDAVHIK